MRVRHSLLGLTLFALAAGCADQGGELRDATQRRRAEGAGADSAAEVTPPSADSGETRLPAFAGDTPRAAPPAADSSARDSARPAAGSAWSLASRQGGRSQGMATLRGLRTASQDGFDRLVLDFGDQPLPGWHAEYAARPGAQCGSGEPVQLAGARFLRLRLQSAQAHDEQGEPTVRQRSLELNMPALRALRLVCDFEGEVGVVLGVNAANPYRVLELGNPSRLVLDVRQQP
jgi:hypothetical protein